MKNIVFGSDNELMILSGTKLLSALPLIGGRKQDPTIFPDGTAMQADNVNAEMNTVPAKSFNQFEDSWVSVVASTEKHIQKQVADAKLVAIASADFDDDQLDNEEARLFGCEPDFNAYELDVNEMPADAVNKPLRTAGGHIHIGINESDQTHEMLLDDFGKIRTTQAMDLFVGLPWVWLDITDDAVRRRQLYGKASAHRPKPYGVEYRALSNTWCKNRELALLTYHLTQAGVWYAMLEQSKNEERLNMVEQIGSDTIQTVINTGDMDTARQLFRDYVAEHADRFIPGVVDMLKNAEANLTDERHVLTGW